MNKSEVRSPAGVAQPMPQSADSPPTDAFCSHCGSQALVNAAFCGNCGSRIFVTAPVSQPTADDRGSTMPPPPAGFTHAAGNGHGTAPFAPVMPVAAFPYQPAPPPSKTNAGLIAALVTAGITAVGAIVAVVLLASGGSSNTTTVSTAAAAASPPAAGARRAVIPITPAVVSSLPAARSPSKARPGARVTTTHVASASASVTSTSPTTASVADAQGVRQSVMREWAAINSQDYAAAYDLFVPGSLGSESAFISGHQQDGKINASVSVGSATFASSTSATVPVLSLTTNDSGGCKNWTGSYNVQKVAGQWLIDKANITSSAC